jgi:hypothetical protein
MIGPFVIDRSQGSLPWVVFEIESPTPSKRREKVAMDILVATQISAQFFGIIRKTWERFHEMLIQEAERGSREHEVTSKRRQELQVSYNEGIRLSFSLRQMTYIKMVVDEAPRESCRHLDFPV